MLNQVSQVHCQARNVVASTTLLRFAMSTEIRNDDAKLDRKPIDISLKDLPGTCKAMQLNQVKLVLCDGTVITYKNEWGIAAATIRLIVQRHSIVRFECRHDSSTRCSCKALVGDLSETEPEILC